VSRTISWFVLFPKQPLLKSTQVEAVAHEIADADFKFINPHQGRILVLNEGAQGFAPIDDEKHLFQHIAAHPISLVSIWKGDLEISLEFDPTGAMLTELTKTHKIDDAEIFGTIAIYLDYTYLRNPERITSVVDTVQHLFGRISSCIEAPFGFALDTLAVEFFADHWHVQQEIASHTVPSVCFPVSYYSKDYFSPLSLAAFDKLGYVCTPIDSTGFLVTNLNELLGDDWEGIPGTTQ
jgi:hypothetical protein